MLDAAPMIADDIDWGPWVASAVALVVALIGVVAPAIAAALKWRGGLSEMLSAPRIMESTFHFDAAGLDAVIPARQWSREALEEVQSGMNIEARALFDQRNYTDARAYVLLERKLDELSAR